MFGTVTAVMIANELKHQFEISLDKRKIHLAHPLRTLGDHDVELRLHHEVNATLKVRIESTTPLPTPAEAPAAEAKPAGEKTEKRGRGRHTEAAAPTEEKAEGWKSGEGSQSGKAGQEGQG